MANGGTEATHRTDSKQNSPRAIIHKKILDHADANPDASMEAIADAISGATTTTVERVLEEYGDPAADSNEEIAAEESDKKKTPEPELLSAEVGQAATDGGAISETNDASVTDDSAAESAMTVEQDPDNSQESKPILDWSELTEKQRETLRAIFEHPDATQAELADRLGVSSPTISQRVNSITGFDWSNRHALVAPLFDSDGDGKEEGSIVDNTEDENNKTNKSEEEAIDTDQPVEDTTEKSTTEDQLVNLVEQVNELSEQIATVEQELTALKQQESVNKTESSVLADPELAHKIIHACMHSDRITEEEELQLLRDISVADTIVQSDKNSVNSA